jgi:hypothetical protein
MRVLVCGGRLFSDRATLYYYLDELSIKHGHITIIEGGGAGADRLAYDWAFERRPMHLIHEPADWKTHGKAAGPMRNQKMLDEHKPDLVLAFPGGRGTADMVRRAKSAGIKVFEPGTIQ